jgi:exodeoxyribonuclease V alpha subunit
VKTVYQRSALDRHFADFIIKESGGASDILGAVASMVSNDVGDGHICLNLADIAGHEILIDAEKVTIPELEELRKSLFTTPVVGPPGDFRPLILDDAGRLYLYRYWKYEQDLARVILDKAGAGCNPVDKEILSRGLAELFPETETQSPDWQKAAAIASLRKKFTIISGGPGTGKTSTVIKIIALLLEQKKGATLRIALAAPTGKSAMRLKASILSLKENLKCEDAVKALIPEEVSTVHRLLGVIAGSVRFRYSDRNLLPYDVVIIDEASMVPLTLMARLAVALKQDSRLILIGDRNQLASVEAGAVLGDICGGDRQEIFTDEFGDLFSCLTGINLPASKTDEQTLPLADSLVILKKNYRFPADSGIGAAGQAVNEGKGRDAVNIFKDSTFADIVWHDVPGPDRLKKDIMNAVLEGYGTYLAAGTAGEALRLFDTFRFLCAMHQGPYGVAKINSAIEEILAAKGLINPRDRWYRGRPVLITVNDYSMKLFNGDIGITLPDPEEGGRQYVFFPASNGGVRKISPVRLPLHETVYAMTIHKSQGSEFDRIHMILPGKDFEILTRELIYTGITRARHKVEIWGNEEIVVNAISRKTDRRSGLKGALWFSHS